MLKLENLKGLRVHFRKLRAINPSFQSKVILYGLSIAGFALLVTYIAIQFFFERCHLALVTVGMPADHPLYLFIREQQNYMGAIFLGTSLLSILFGGVVGLILSHRIAGPLHRMKEHLLAIAAGRAPQLLKFRKKDYFQELAEAYNAELMSRGRVRRPGSEPNRVSNPNGPPNGEEEQSPKAA